MSEIDFDKIQQLINNSDANSGYTSANFNQGTPNNPIDLLDLQKQLFESLKGTPTTAPTHTPTKEEAISALGALRDLGNLESPTEASIFYLSILLKWAMTQMPKFL